MLSGLNEQITDCCVKAIRKSFTPCPLIGPKWLQEYPQGRPADYRFVGIPKLAKATGRSVEKTGQIIAKNLSLAGLHLDMEIVKGGYINLNVKGHSRPESRKSGSTPIKEKKAEKTKVEKQGKN